MELLAMAISQVRLNGASRSSVAVQEIRRIEVVIRCQFHARFRRI